MSFIDSLRAFFNKPRKFLQTPAAQWFGRNVANPVEQFTQKVSEPVANEMFKVANLPSAALKGAIDETNRPIASVKDILSMPFRPGMGIVKGLGKGLQSSNYGVMSGIQSGLTKVGVNPTLAAGVGLGAEILIPGPGELGILGKAGSKVDDLARATKAAEAAKTVKAVKNVPDILQVGKKIVYKGAEHTIDDVTADGKQIWLKSPTGEDVVANTSELVQAPAKKTVKQMLKTEKAVTPKQEVVLPKDVPASTPPQQINPEDFSKPIPHAIQNKIAQNEPYAPKGMRQRGMFKAAEEGTSLPPKTQEAVLSSPDRYYTPEPMKPLIENSNKAIVDEATATNKIQEVTRLDPKAITSQDISDLAAATKKLQGKSPELDAMIKEAWGNTSKAGTAAGQTGNAFKLFYNTTTEGKAMLVTKTINQILENPSWIDRLSSKIFKTKRGATTSLTPDQEVQIYKLFKKVDSVTDPVLKEQKALEAFNEVAKMMPYGVSDFISSLRYNGMLSSITTQARNLYGNALQTGIIRPATKMFTRGQGPKAVARYYAGMAKSFKTALKEAKMVYNNPTNYYLTKEFSNSSIKRMLTRRSYDPSGIKSPVTRTAAKVAVGNNIPTKGLEAADKFFSTLISRGEYEDLIARGFDVEVAQKSSAELAEYSLFRAALDPTNKSGQGTLLSGIDKLMGAVEKFREMRGGDWIVPFIRTPLNVAKQMIEYSPIGLAEPTIRKVGHKVAPDLIKNGSVNPESWSKAIIGTGVFATGAVMAANGDTVWDAPTDKKQAAAWYASGKKPRSVKVGDRYIPMSYFGPAALAFAMPAAWHYYHNDAKTAISDTEVEKVSKAVQDIGLMWMNQTAFSGIQSALSIFSDPEGYGAANRTARTMAFTLGQIIPDSGFQRWLANTIDPFYKDANGVNAVETFKLNLQKGIPFMSKGVPNYQDIEGTDSKRPTSLFGMSQMGLGFPYEVGKDVPEYSALEEGLKQQYQINSVMNRMDNAVEKGNAGELERLSEAIGAAPINSPEGKVFAGEEAPNVPTAKPSVQDILNRKAQENLVNDRINSIMKLPIDAQKKMDMITKMGITGDQYQAWQDKQIKDLNVSDKVEYIQTLDQPDFADLYRKKVLTLEVAQELERKGVIPDAGELIDKLKWTDPVYMKDQMDKWQEKLEKIRLQTAIKANKSTASLLKKRKGISLKTKGYSASNFRRSSSKTSSYRVRSPKSASNKIDAIAYSGNSSALKRLRSYK